MCNGYAQANLVVLPRELAFDFLLFTQRNPRPCPVLDNPGRLTELVEASGAHSTDLASPERACDYCDRCVNAAEQWAPVADDMWANDPNKKGTQYTGKMAKKG